MTENSNYEKKRKKKRIVKSEKKSKVRMTVKVEEREVEVDSREVSATVDGLYQLSTTNHGNTILKPIAVNGRIDQLKTHIFKSLADFERDFMDQINDLRGDLDCEYVNHPTETYMIVKCTGCKFQLWFKSKSGRKMSEFCLKKKRDFYIDPKKSQDLDLIYFRTICQNHEPQKHNMSVLKFTK